MEQETYLLPVRCKGCNVVFDLWAILQEQEKRSSLVSAENQFSRLLRQSFCSQCKKAILLGVADQEELESERDAEEDEIETMLEIE